jgi:RimJ/RimL family protein N-acetyltransferase
MTFSIRELNPDDAPQMRELRLLGLQTDSFAFGASYETESLQPLAFFESRCTSSDGNVLFGAFVEEELVAITSIVREQGLKTKHHAGIYAVYTHPNFRGQGISGALLRKAINTAKEWQGLEFIQLGVATNNPAAIAVYKKAGFKTWGTQEAALMVNGEYFDEHYMALDLR